MSALVKQDGTAIAPTTIYEVFREMALDPAIDPSRIAALMDLQIKAEERNAEKEFNAAFARLLPKLPRVVKRGRIDMGGKGTIAFAKIEDIDRVIRPLYVAEGFTLSFLSQPCATGVLRVATLRHSAGHSITSTMSLPPDKGPGRNDLQALGSSMSYCDRYLMKGLFNIITEGDDRDGSSLEFINQSQVDQLDGTIHDLGMDDRARSKFMETLGVKALGEITKGKHFTTAQNLLAAKGRSQAKEPEAK